MRTFQTILIFMLITIGIMVLSSVAFSQDETTGDNSETVLENGTNNEDTIESSPMENQESEIEEMEIEEMDSDHSEDATADEPSSRDNMTGITVGGGGGFAWMFNINENLTANTEDRLKKECLYIHVLSDFGFLDAYIGEVGVNLHGDFLLADPKNIYLSFGLFPRFRFVFPLDVPLFYGVHPYLGWNLQLGWKDLDNYYFFVSTGVAWGVQLELFLRDLYFDFKVITNLFGTYNEEIHFPGDPFNREVHHHYIETYMLSLAIAYKVL